LPILASAPAIDGVPPLDEYYRRNVSGGPGAFVLPAQGLGSFARAVRRKIIMEVAGRTPDTLTG